MTKETTTYLKKAGAFALPIVLTAVGVLAFAWRAGVQIHHPEFCVEETAAVASKSLKCETKGQKIEFIEKRDRTWAVCRCPQ